MHLQRLSIQQEYTSNLEAFTQAALILFLGVAIITSNALIIATIINFRGPTEVINCYLLSLACVDLLCGLVIVPLSVYPALTGNWLYGDLVCRFVGYLEVTLWSITVYTFMWISVDRYLAVRKPLRYETVQTKTRCQCWMVFTWISSMMLCCPPLLGYSKPIFDEEAYICKLDWGNMAAYSATLAILVLGPSVISIVHNYGYIFIMMRRLKSGAPIHDKEYATALAENLANPSHLMSFALVFSFWVSWAPFIIVRLYELIFDTLIDIPMLHFAIVWLGVMNSFWKILIMMSMSPQFRLHLRVFCLTICCKTKGRLQAELIGLDPDD
ncbi:G-protein coupled receptor 52 [Contarinia nasturtii]|uniref:G-protein coupled receptor 52 n=1 Tax=Contarinia nasturtii TaxID=265458 RepID=UPI0012D4229B|nr:G-protein coupled receptor 52 [Contarinia nasturtii]XP_031616548.1 G-protein coupled receptor 52 [Contarinia nasturtii]XP_031616557.1 G-protein coupled receptor 52 [Contarinia nasturtii]XP_031616567.1 G-protein coupled receptor 52 [Contarinia nasturtii]XP_031616576.1 G-protein coupled receptor 52 [Contarinia nasturtii]XP_031616585.1 G-protein coupled receptor 52 [Contarinia nasturtii]